jgi:hypothetical protein
MPRNSVNDWDTNADLNTDIGGVNIAENCPPSGINNAIRSVMAQVKSAIAGLVSKVDGAFTGDVSVTRPGSPSVSVNSVGKVIGKLVAQSDGNLVFYRNEGSGEVPVWSASSTTFNVDRPITRQGATVWDAINFNPSAKANKSGDEFTGDVGITHSGSSQIFVNSTGSVIGRLIAQPDNNVVFYRDVGNGNTPYWSANSSGFNILTGATFSGSLSRDAQYYFQLSGSNPVINFDDNDYMVFDRANNVFSWVISGQSVMTLSADGTLRTRGPVIGRGL